MYESIYELDYRKSRFQQNVPGLPAEFKDVMIKIPYTSHGWISILILTFADQMVKSGTAIRNTLVKLDEQEIYY